MKKALFGAGIWGQRALKYYGYDKVGIFVDNNKTGKYLGKKILNFDEYKNVSEQYECIVCVKDSAAIMNMLSTCAGISYSLFPPLKDKDMHIPLSIEIQHSNWQNYLHGMFDKPGMEILEIGSRQLVGDGKSIFSCANHTGFDIHPGENVDRVGDAHRLLDYFKPNTKFDLIFSSAVFEHLAMPWVVSEQMVALLKPQGYVFVETHYSFSSHGWPWHFFQFSEKALEILFPREMGIEKVYSGVSNPIEGYFTEKSSPYLRGQRVSDMYCHSEFLGKKVDEVC
jgi:hypothetical protein